jgi:hypothetical protein
LHITGGPAPSGQYLPAGHCPVDAASVCQSTLAHHLPGKPKVWFRLSPFSVTFTLIIFLAAVVLAAGCVVFVEFASKLTAVVFVEFSSKLTAVVLLAAQTNPPIPANASKDSKASVPPGRISHPYSRAD